jgi:hypothetical protein
LGSGATAARAGCWRQQAVSLGGADLFSLLRSPLPETFTTLELAGALGEPRWLAQKLAYCLRETGEIGVCGKDGNALRYRRSARFEDGALPQKLTLTPTSAV